MGREGGSDCQVFKTKADAEAYVKKEKGNTSSPKSNKDGEWKRGYNVYVEERPKVTGKPRSECVKELKDYTEERLSKRYGDCSMLFVIAEIEPVEIPDAVIGTLQKQAVKVGKAMVKAAKHAKVSKEKGFVVCSYCHSSLAADKLSKDDLGRGSCPICNHRGEDKFKNIDASTLFYDDEHQETETFGKIVRGVFIEETDASQSLPLFVGGGWNGHDYSQRGNYLNTSCFSSRPLFEVGFETAIESARTEARAFIAKQLELKRNPALAKEGTRKRKVGEKIPVPKSKSGFDLFKDEQRPLIKQANPEIKGLGPVQKKLGEMWKSLGEEQKKPYMQKSEIDKQRYARELEAWKTANPAAFKRIQDAKEEKKMKWVVCMECLSGHF